jgi:hypothetical protein
MKVAVFAFLLALTASIINHCNHSTGPFQAIEKTGTTIRVEDDAIEVENITMNFSETSTNWVQSIQTQNFIIY